MKFGSILAILIGLIVIAPGALGATAQTGGAGADRGISNGVVKIGLLLDLSGPYSNVTGQGSATAARMAVEDFGGKVLGKPIEVVVADHHDNTDRAASLARQWFDTDHVDAIMDVSSSSPALAVQAIARARGKIVMLSAPGAERLTNEACSPTAVHYVWDTYAVARTLGRAIVARGGDSWYFITVDYSFGFDLENETAAVVRALGGTVLGHARHPLNIQDFTSYLLRARHSRAKVIGLANAGADLVNTIRQADKLGIVKDGQTLAGLGAVINNVHTLGLQASQGMLVTEAFYWDMDNATRAWSRRFYARMHEMPNSFQAGVYSSTMHYLQAIKAAGTDAAGPVMQRMRRTPINDFFVHHGHIRADGVMVHDMYLFQVKKPSESKYPWDYYSLLAVIPGDEAFRPVEQSRCPLLHKQ